MPRKSTRWPERYTPPPWLPDWKDATAYNHRPYWMKPEEMHLFFAWQFLRRNPKYQEIYALKRELCEHYDSVLSNRKADISSHHVIGNYGYCQKDGITLYTRGKNEPSVDDSLQNTASFFLLSGFIPDPAFNDFIMPRLNYGNNVRLPGWISNDKFDIHHRLIQIDIRYPLEPQITRAHEMLKEEQADEIGNVLRPTHKNRDEAALIRYLRTLDADATGVAPREIVAVLHSDKRRYAIATGPATGKGSHSPANKALNKDREEAIKLRDTGWRTLLD